MRTKVINNPVKDWPYRDLLPVMVKWRDEGKSVVPKFTCENCGRRAFGQVGNLGRFQTCSECGSLHDWAKSGGNYALGQIINPDLRGTMTNEEATEEWLEQHRKKG